MYKGKFAVLTRGYSRENGYHWKASWLDRNDTVPDRHVRDHRSLRQLEDTLAGDIPGVVIAQLDGQFSALLSGLPSEYRSEVSPGPIYVKFALFELTQEQARAIACAFLKDWEARARELVSLISRAKSDPEWDFDVERVRAFIDGLPSDAGTSGELGRVRNHYRRPEGGGFAELVSKLEGRELGARDGLRVVIGHPYDSAAQGRICDEADVAVLPSFPQPSLRDTGGSPAVPKPWNRNGVLFVIAGAIAVLWLLLAVAKKKEERVAVDSGVTKGAAVTGGTASAGAEGVKPKPAEGGASASSAEGNSQGAKEAR